MEEKKDWMKIARAVAVSRGWIAWIDTAMMMEEGKPGEVQFFQASFRVRRELERCPHCGKPIWHSFDGQNDYVLVSDPRNITCDAEDIEGAWKGLVEDYAKAFGKTVPEVEFGLSAGGYL